MDTLSTTSPPPPLQIPNRKEGATVDCTNPLNPTWLALSRLRRRKFDSAIQLATVALEENPRDETSWFIKTRALTQSVYVDDMDVEEESIADIMLDENAMAKAPRPGTSLRRPLTGSQTGGGLLRPVSKSGAAPTGGFLRPGSKAGRLDSSRMRGLSGLTSGARPGSSRPISVSGRFLRLGTASILTGNRDVFIQVDKLNLDSFARKPALAKALIDYLIYFENNPRIALDLAAKMTEVAGFKDWWVKARLGKCYYRLGMYREAEQQFRSALKTQDMITTNLELAKIFYRIDQPNAALAVYGTALDRIKDPSFAIGTARIFEALGDIATSVSHYRTALMMDPTSVESLACIAAHHFYIDQPEVAIRYYRHILQMGVVSCEVWNNLGLSCFYSGQYDIALGCFDKALLLADELNASDVWYNISRTAIALGDLNLAYQALKISVATNANNGEAFVNLALLELRKNNVEVALGYLKHVTKTEPGLFEGWYNLAVVYYRQGKSDQSYSAILKARELHPEHRPSQELQEELEKLFAY